MIQARSFPPIFVQRQEPHLFAESLGKQRLLIALVKQQDLFSKIEEIQKEIILRISETVYLRILSNKTFLHILGHTIPVKVCDFTL